MKKVKAKARHIFGSLTPQPSTSRAPSPTPASSPAAGPHPPIQDPFQVIVNPSGDTSLNRTADSIGVAYQGVKAALRLVERASDVFPLLKSSVAGVLGIVDTIEVHAVINIS